MYWYLFVYFFVGVIQDFLLTLDLRYIAKDKAILAMIFSFIATAVSMLVLYNILTKLDSQRSTIAIIVYSLGISIGTFLATKFKLGMGDKN